MGSNTYLYLYLITDDIKYLYLIVKYLYYYVIIRYLHLVYLKKDFSKPISHLPWCYPTFVEKVNHEYLFSIVSILSTSASCLRCLVIFSTACYYTIDSMPFILLNYCVFYSVTTEEKIHSNTTKQSTIHLWPLLLTWFNFNPSMDK